ncbi:MAG: hypoxanthine phosphoribosyltransferase [Bacteroidia bacterium]
MNKVEIEGKVFEIYLSDEDINKEIERIAEAINLKHKDTRPLFLSVLNGAFMFTSDLLKKVNIECDLSFVKLSSYTGTTSSGEVKQLVGLNENIAGRHIIVLEDIVDTGLTMKMLLKKLHEMNPAKIEIATLLLKPEALQEKIKVDYICFEIPEKFVVGYGLDLNGLGRNLPNIYQLK